MPVQFSALDAVYEAIDDLNQVLPPEQHVSKAPDAALLGEASTLDSMGLVNLIVLVEEKVQDHQGLAVSLVDERAMSREKSPFRTVGSLAGYVEEVVRASKGHVARN